MPPTRRELLATAAGLTTATGLAIFTTSQPSSAASLSGEFTIPDKHKQVQNPVSGLKLTVTGTAGWESDTQPTKAVLRLEIARSGAFQQLAATTLPDLKRDYSHEFAFKNVDLLQHERLTVAAINPTSLGETEAVDLQARLTLRVLKDGHTLATDELTEQIKIEVSKTQGEIEVSFGASGNVTIQTSS